VPWDRYLALVDTRPAWARFARRLVENLYLQKLEREYELLAVDAAERYRRTLARFPASRRSSGSTTSPRTSASRPST
jgi:hypothetical protein